MARRKTHLPLLPDCIWDRNRAPHRVRSGRVETSPPTPTSLPKDRIGVEKSNGFSAEHETGQRQRMSAEVPRSRPKHTDARSSNPQVLCAPPLAKEAKGSHYCQDNGGPVTSASRTTRRRFASAWYARTCGIERNCLPPILPELPPSGGHSGQLWARWQRGPPVALESGSGWR